MIEMNLVENPLTKLKKTLNGMAEGIYSFGIITAENPMGEKSSSKENKERQDRLKQYLREGLFQYIIVKGKYGNLENPVVILNINKDELLNLGKIFDQESVIFARNYFEYVEFQYWQQEGNGRFTKLDISDYYSNLSDPEDFYTYKKSWKFNIPFSIFESMNKFYAFKYRDLKEDTLENLNKLNKRIVTEDKKTLKHFYELRGRIGFFLKEQPVKLVNRDINKFQEAGAFNTGYWVKSNDVYEVDKNHIRFVLDNPETFDFSKEDLLVIYRKHKEKIGQEGKAREEIIRECASRGWIRVRFYKTPNSYWSIQFDSYRKRKKSIEKFIDYALDYLGMDLRDAISLLGYEDNFSANYSFAQGGISSFLINEEKKRVDKRKK